MNFADINKLNLKEFNNIRGVKGASFKPSDILNLDGPNGENDSDDENEILRKFRNNKRQSPQFRRGESPYSNKKYT